MTERNLSKAGLSMAAFLVSGAMVFSCLPHAFGQSASDPVDLLETVNPDSIYYPDDGSFDDQDSAQTASSTDIPGGDENAAEAEAEPEVPLALSPRTQQAAGRASASGQVSAAGSVDPDNPASGSFSASPRSNIAAGPAQSGTGQNAEENPFGPTGFRIGTFNANASLEQAIGYSSNLSGRVNGEGGAFSQTEVALSLISDWSRHELRTNIIGSYMRPFDTDEIDEPQLFADTALRLDLIDGYTLTTRGFYSAQTQSFTSSTLVPGAIDTPLQQAFGGSVELRRADRRLQFTLRGSVDRNIFEDADLGGGFTQSQDDRNNNLYQMTARVGYETSPSFTPFVEGIYGIREFDERFDRNGNRRDSEIFELRGGLEIDLGEKVQGEISLGYVSEEFDDPFLDDLTGFTLNGQIDWSPERETLVSVSLGTRTNDSITLNENGSIIYTARLDYTRQITNRFSINAFADIELEDNTDSDTTMQVGFGTEYWVNRFMALTADIEYESFTSDAANSDFDELGARMGVRFQR